MESIISIFSDGGVLITYPIFILLLLVIFLFVREMIRKKNVEKTKSLIASIGWFVIAWGYMGRTFGLISAFDRVAAAGDIAPELLSAGLKMALIGPLMALFTFIIARAAIIIFILVEKKK